MANFRYDPVKCQKMVKLSQGPDPGFCDMNGGIVVVRRFAQGGFDIALISRDQRKLDGIAETLNSEGYTESSFMKRVPILRKKVLK